MGCGASTQSPAPKVVDAPPVKEHPPAAATAASGATPTPAATTPAALAGGSQSEDKAEGKIQSAQRGKATRKAKAEAEKAVGAFGMKMVGEEAHSMDEVAAFSAFEFKKPVPTTPPITTFDPGFLKALTRTKPEQVTLKSGRTICYFSEGEPSDLPVLCVHGLMQSKELWLQPEPIPGVHLICIDRFGHGNSSPAPVPYLYDQAVGEIGEFMTAIGVEKFHACGHSMGGSFVLQISAGLPDRVLGCAAISGLCDMHHPSLPESERKATIPPGADVMAAAADMNSWKGGLARSALRNLLGKPMTYKNKAKDFGFAKQYVATMRKDDGGCERTWAAMDKDPFFVSKTLYTYLHGFVDQHAVVSDFACTFAKWHFPCENFKGPMFIYNGNPEATILPMAQQNHLAIPQSELIIMEGHGHSTIVMEAPSIIKALVQGKSVQAQY